MKILFGAGVATTAVLTILTEPAADLGFQWMIALRVIEGLPFCDLELDKSLSIYNWIFLIIFDFK